MRTTALLLSTLLAPASLTPIEPIEADQLFEIAPYVDSVAATFMDRYAVPGMAIAVVKRGQRRIFSYGVASKESGAPVTPDTLFELGSISKTFTVTLATYSEARGKLSMDGTVGKHLPALSGRPIGQIPLWQLATHSGGGFPLQFPNGVRSERDAMRYYLDWNPSYPGGVRRSYANPSIALLGVITAESLGLSFEHAMEGVLFPKLGLTDTWLRVPMEGRKFYAQGYNPAGIPVRLSKGPLSDQAYGIRSTARDLLRFVELNISPGTDDPLLDRALLKAQVARFKVGPMFQDLIWEQYPYPIAVEALVKGNSDDMVYNVNPTIPITTDVSQGEWLLNKTGGTSGFSSYVLFVPSRQLGIVILTNKSHPNEGRVRLAYALLQLLDRLPPP
ncbi:class C beta-lactamase [Stenotrophomonas sp. SAU14A_NAIMI4_8]|uniref:class C beta-lactamase n=1 Tax=Stenotrophomonas sp. SAU14A_NAIMI4_8 TaxID=2072409 RepID=UPI00131F3485|nr:class C beta-lactamase [Stenotrophomonas sp. SAU14A_NAIMI4_8]